MFDQLGPQQGTVEEFNGQFGFLRTEDGRRVYFHLDGQRAIFASWTQPVFLARPLLGGAIPRVGDAVRFIPGLTSNGAKAKFWAYAAEYERALREIAARTLDPALVSN